MKKDVLAYNLVFPMCMLYMGVLILPVLIIILFPLNFIVDTAMLFLLFFLLKLPDKKRLYKDMIAKTWGFGFLADFIASFVMTYADVWLNPPNIYSIAPWEDWKLFLFVTVGIALAGALIYVFQRKFVLKEIALEERQKRRLALGMAILTAPYMMYLPPI